MFVNLAAEFDQNVRPLQNVLEKLHSLKIIGKEAHVPPIVVVGGDPSHSGKASFFELFTGITLPRHGQNTATTDPLVRSIDIRLRPATETCTRISFDKGKTYKIADDREVTLAITTGADDAVNPVMLHIEKPNAPDLKVIFVRRGRVFGSLSTRP